MACAKPSDCAPCSKCPDSPAPVMPRCDITLNDGVYNNATIAVEGGCIIDVTQGVPLLYQPDNNCAGTGGAGGAGISLPGDQGDPGEAATVEIGTVFSVAYNAVPTVQNVGTPNHAILEIGIPRGEPGTPAPTITGVSVNDAGINFVNGVLKSPLPAAWPPLLDILPATIIGAGASLTFTKRPADAMVEVVLNLQGMIDAFNLQITALSDANAAQQLQIDDLLTRVAAREGP